MNDRTKLQELEELLAEQTEGRLDEAQAARLSELLSDDPEHRRFYLDYCQMHTMLAWHHGVLGGLDRLDAVAKPAPRRRRVAWAGGAVAFAAAAGIALWLGTRERPPVVAEAPPPSGPPVATVSELIGARLEAQGRPGAIERGQGLQAGAYRLRTGFAQVDFGYRARLIFEAPASFTIASVDNVVIQRGRVSTKVFRPGIGFTIETPSNKLIDHGTEFAVEVDEHQAGEVHVFSGRVDVQSKRDGLPPVDLRTRQAARFFADDAIAAGIDFDPQRFVTALTETDDAYARAVLALGPVVYFRMSPDRDGNLRDASGNGHHGLIHNSDGRAPPWGAGLLGTALRLEGPTGSYGIVPDYPKTTDDRLSASAWVWADSRPRWASIAKNWGQREWGQFHFGLRVDIGTLEVQVRDDGGREVSSEDTEPLPLRRWVHVAFVADGRMLRLYRDGREVAAQPYTHITRHDEVRALGIGTKLNAEGTAPQSRRFGFWDGRIDELALFNRPLTPVEIAGLGAAHREPSAP